MILTAFFTSFGPESQPSWRPSHPRAGGSAPRAFPFPAATHVRDKIKRPPATALQGPAQGDLSGLCFASAVMGADSIRARVVGSRGSTPLLLGGFSIPPPPPQDDPTGRFGVGGRCSAADPAGSSGTSVASPADTAHSTRVIYPARLLTPRQLDKPFN